MAFRNIGTPAGEFSEDSIKRYLKVYFPQWLKTYNFENYTNHVFNSEIAINCKVDLDLLTNGQEQYSLEKKKAKNNFITVELLTIGHFIKWLENAFKYLSEGNEHLTFHYYKEWFEAYDSKNIDFITDLKNNKDLGIPQFRYLMMGKFDTLTKEETMYFLTVMYLDFVNIQEFLHDRFEPIPKEKKKKEVTINNFFPRVAPETVEAIQEEFKDLAIGKNMAILIYLLDKEHKIVFIDDSDRKKGSRLHFVRAFTGEDLEKINAVNNHLEGSTGELKKINKNDSAYIDIAKRLKQIVSSG